MRLKFVIMTLLWWGWVGVANATDELLKELAQKAAVTDPNVLVHWHDLKAATKEIGVARGGYFPKVDLSSNAGNERLVTPLAQFQPISSSFYRDTTTLTMTQMLYDGFMTHDEVRRLNHVQLSRYFEWFDAMENSALETTQTYFDLRRHEALYHLSEENFVSHRVVFNQIKLKVDAGVGRAVDLEQVKGRMAQSESNLVTDNANVHDMNARLLRFVNELPAHGSNSDPDTLMPFVPEGSGEEQVNSAINNSPAILAAIENVRAAQSDLNERRGKYQPRVDLVLSESRGKNAGGVLGENRDSVAQVVMSWNLFNGGSDALRSDQFMEHLEAARSLREKTCREVRQAVDVAFHGIWTITEQLGYLEQRKNAINQAYYAYKKQFDLGQRSLLDLLDSENELFQANRAYINAQYDRAINVAKTLAGMGKLVSALGLSHLDPGDTVDLASDDSEQPDSCPVELSQGLPNRREELIEKARKQIKPIESDSGAQIPVPTVTPLGVEPVQTPAVEQNDQPEIIKIPAPKAKAADKPKSTPADSKPTDSKPADSKPANSKPANSKPTDSKYTPASVEAGTVERQ